MSEVSDLAGFSFAEEQAKKTSYASGDMVPTGNDAAYDALFYMGRVPNFAGTDYTEVPHLRLRIAGDNNRVYDQPVIMESTPVRPSDPERFPREWNAFMRGQESTTTGTLLADWQGCEPGDVRFLDMRGVKTVEQLAAMSDAQIVSLGMGSRALREAARRHVGGAEDKAKEEMAEQVSKLTGIVQGLMSILTPEQLAQLQPDAQGSGQPKSKQRAA